MQRIKGKVCASAAALAAAFLFVGADGILSHPETTPHARPAASLPQRARLVRLDAPERHEQSSPKEARPFTLSLSQREEGPQDAAPRSTGPLSPRGEGGGEGARHDAAEIRNTLALLALGCLVLWLAARRRFAFQTL